MKGKFFAIILGTILCYLGAFALCARAYSGSVAVGAEVPALKVVVDAGHGGIDGGVVGKKTGVKESDLNLLIAVKLKEKLTEAGFEVVMTRKTEGGLYGVVTKGFKRRDMQKRKSIVENASPTLVVSVHQNFYSSSAQRGGQVFYLPKHEEGQRLAECVQERLNALYKTHSVKGRKAMAADYFMLRFSMPSVIVECGFLSSERDEKLLVTDDFQYKLASMIAAGAIDYLTLKEGGL